MNTSLRALRRYRQPLTWAAAGVALGLLAGCGDDSAPPLVDLALAVDPQTEPIFPVTGQVIRLTFQVTNRSGVFSPGTSARLRIDGSDLAEFTVDGLSPGESRIGVTQFAIGSPGTHSVVLILDPAGGINDPDRGNNVAAVSVFVGLVGSG